MERGLNAIQPLQSALLGVSSIKDAERAVARFFEKWVGAQARITECPATAPDAVTTTLRDLQYDLVLLVRRETPLSNDERALVDAAAGTLRILLPTLLSHQRDVARLNLLQAISRGVSAEWPLDRIYAVMGEHVDAAFPETRIQVLLLDAGEHGLRLQAGFGSGVDSEEPRMADLADSLARMIEDASTVRLEPVSEKELPRLLVPLTIGNAVEGLLAVFVPPGRRLQPDTVSALESLAGLLGTAVSVDKLRTRVRRQDHQLETVYNLTHAARFLQPLEPTLDRLHQRIIEVFTSTISHISLYDSEKSVVTFPSVMENDRRLQLDPLPVDDPNSLTCWVIRNDEPYATADWMAADRPVPGRLQGASPRSILCFPMRAQGEVVGAISIQSMEPNAHSELDYYLLGALAGQVGVIIRNARLHERGQQQLEELTTLYEASAAMTAELELSAVLESIVSSIARALKVSTCTVLIWDSNVRHLRVRGFAERAPGVSGAVHVGVPPARLTEQLETSPFIQRAYEEQLVRQLLDEEVLLPGEAELLETAGWRSLLITPLSWHHQRLGLLLLGQKNDARLFSDSELRLIRNLSNQAAVALEHARLYQQAEKRLDELSAFQRIGLQISSRLGTRVVLDTISEAALEMLGVNNLHIYLYDPDKEEFEFGTALWRDGRRVPAVSLPREEGLTATVARSGNPVVINDARSHPLYQSDESSDWGVAAIAGFPLKVEERVIGVFTVTFLKSHSFGDDELLLLKLLADQASVAVQNARLFDDLQRQLRVMSALVDMAKRVTGSLNVQAVMDTAVETMQTLLNARASSIALLHDDELVIEAAAGINPQYLKSRLDLGEGASGRAVLERRHIYIADTYEEEGFPLFDTAVRSLLAVPLTSRSEVLGTLTVDSTEPAAFDESDIQFLTIASSQVSVAIANARLYEEAQNRAEQLALAFEELQESDRLKDELVQNISHELRTPLTFVKGYADLLLDGAMGDLNPEQHEALAIISDRSDGIERLIQDIVTLQRIEKENLQRRPIHLDELARRAFQAHRLRVDELGLSLELKIEDGDLVIHADRERMNQVMDNLLGNAIKFSPDGGLITVILSRHGEQAQIAIRDQGVGIPRDKQKRVFERFYQVDGSSIRRFGGAGIGLALVKRIVEAHDGKIWLESVPNRGSTFYVALPLAQPDRDDTVE